MFVKLLFMFTVFFCGVFGKTLKIPDVYVDSVEIRGISHKKEILLKNIDRPYQLSYYKHSHKLFFSYNIGEDASDTFKIAYLEKNTSRHMDLDVDNGFAIAIDQENHVVFLGGIKGVYKYHPDEQKKEPKQILSDYNIWDMFYKNGELYYITYPEQNIYKYEVHKNDSRPKRVKHIQEKIYQFVIDGEEDTYFTNATGLFRIKNSTHDRIHYHGETVFRAIALDKKGEAYFAGRHGIFVATHHNNTLHEIARIRNIFGLTFDDDNNIIYSNPTEIVKLKPHVDSKKPK